MEVLSLCSHEQTHNQPKEPQNGAKDLDNEDLDKQGRVSSIGDCCGSTSDTNSNSTDHVTEANGQASPEQGVARVQVGRGIQRVSGCGCEFGGEHDGGDQSVDGDNFTEDDADQVLGGDTWGTDTSADDGGTGDKDSPGCANDGEADARGDSQVGPQVGRRCLEELAKVERFSLACEEDVYGDLLLA